MSWLRGATQAGPPAGRDLASIRIFTDEIELNGFVATSGQRITDILLRGEDIPFLPAGADVRPENWIRISPTEILFVAPPPLGPRAAWHEPRDRQVIALRIAGHRVRGTAHLAPGIEAQALPGRQAFLPLTDARVDDERFSVVIVNLGRATLDASAS